MPPPPFFLISVLHVLCSGEAVQQVSVSAQQVSVSTQQVLACLRGGGVHAGTRGRSGALGSVSWFGEGASAGARNTHGPKLWERIHTHDGSANMSDRTNKSQLWKKTSACLLFVWLLFRHHIPATITVPNDSSQNLYCSDSGFSQQTKVFHCFFSRRKISSFVH